jgi:predicted nucleic acid-binding protein
VATADRRVAYVDSSALVKLIVREPETAALRQELARWPRRVSSSLATHLGGVLLRSLDAIHLATAASVRADLGALITYDSRMISEAEVLGLPVLSPQ